MTLVVFGIPIHFCAHEAMMILMVVGAIPFVGTWLRAKLVRKHKQQPCAHDHPKEGGR